MKNILWNLPKDRLASWQQDANLRGLVPESVSLIPPHSTACTGHAKCPAHGMVIPMLTERKP